jgi:hypothetical protein
VTKEEQIMAYLDEKVFFPIINSNESSSNLKNGARITRERMSKLNAPNMIKYYLSAIVGTDRSVKFAKDLKESGFTRFEEVIEEFRIKFGDAFLLN